MTFIDLRTIAGKAGGLAKSGRHKEAAQVRTRVKTLRLERAIRLAMTTAPRLSPDQRRHLAQLLTKGLKG